MLLMQRKENKWLLLQLCRMFVGKLCTASFTWECTLCTLTCEDI